MRALAWLACALILPCGPLWADEARVLAEYRARSGSLPPEYAWSTDITIRSDGILVLKHCKGYTAEGAACVQHEAQVETAKIAAIETALAASGLTRKAARSTELAPVGGGTVSGTVYHTGVAILLPAFPVKRDAKRVATVLSALRDAVPDEVRQRISAGN